MAPFGHQRSPALRVAALALLLVLASVGVAALGAVDLSGTPPVIGANRHTAPLLAAGLLVWMAVAGILSLRRRRSGAVKPPPGPRTSVLRTLITLMIFALLWVVLDVGHHLPSWHIRQPPSPGSSGVDSSQLPDLTDPATITMVVLILAVVLLAVVGLLSWRAGRRLAAAPTITADDTAAPDDVPASAPALRDALTAGETAMESAADSRAAILACYAAMESALAVAGTARAAAETPSELLARAGTAGLFRSDAAATLTALFHEARFSSHAMDESDRRSATLALAQLSHELEQV